MNNNSIIKANNSNLKNIPDRQPNWALVNLNDLTIQDFLLLKQFKHPGFLIETKSNQLKLKINNEIMSISYENILRLEARSNYTIIFLMGSKKPILTSKTLKFYVHQLATKTFVRPHQSHLVNSTFIEAVVLKPKPYLILTNGLKIKIARRRLSEFRKLQM